MKKTTILQAVLVELENDLRRLQAANVDASAGATSSEARAETKWDTCGLESSYLARGHAMQFKKLAADVCELRAFPLLSFVGKSIGSGALIEVEQGGGKMHFFLLPFGGGVEVTVEGRDVTVITPESPVGAALLDKKQGDTYSFRAGSSGKIPSIE
jgi:hypothetical protein